MMRLLLIKICGLMSSAGGPLFLFDSIKLEFGSTPAFVISFIPTGLAIFGALSLEDDPESKLSRFVVWLGFSGVVTIQIINAYAILKLSTGSTHPDSKLIVFAIIVSIVGSILYFLSLRNFKISITQ